MPTNRDPNMLERKVDILLLAISLPFQSLIGLHGADTDPFIGDPFLDDELDELDLTPEVISPRNALNHGINFRTTTSCSFAGTRIGFSHEVEKSLDRVGEALTIVEGGYGDGAFDGEVASCFEGEVIEIAPRGVGGDDDLGVIGKVELVKVSC